MTLLWSLVVDDGVIAASGNYSLQVYDGRRGKPLCWHGPTQRYKPSQSED